VTRLTMKCLSQHRDLQTEVSPEELAQTWVGEQAEQAFDSETQERR